MVSSVRPVKKGDVLVVQRGTPFPSNAKARAVLVFEDDLSVRAMMRKNTRLVCITPIHGMKKGTEINVWFPPSRDGVTSNPSLSFPGGSILLSRASPQGKFEVYSP